jgi:NAD(P)-dependent dehydrogenase (short-subunit alcohol dehydrogenase family)
MKNKTVVITGANSGIGYVTALEIAKLGARLVLICRNKAKGEQAQQQIMEKAKNQSVSLKIADLSSQKEVRRVASEISQEYPVIDVLVNNVGVIIAERQLSIDNIEMTWATNHLGYFLLTNLLLGNLQAAGAARIVNVASQASWIGTIQWEDINFSKSYSAMGAYAQSKLANIMFTNELANRLKDTAITTNAVHPGAVGTNFGRNMTGFIGKAFQWFGSLMRSPEKGAETSIWLAVHPDLERVTGKYFADKKPIKAKAIAYQPENLERLWMLSEEMTAEK